MHLIPAPLARPATLPARSPAIGAERAIVQMLVGCVMPEMFGDELIARVRERQPDLQVLVVTGHSQILESIAPPWWQEHSHLEKPFEVEVLRQRVSDLIGDAHHIEL